MVFNFGVLPVKATEILYNRVLRDIVDAPWYIRNDNLHKDLAVKLSIASLKSMLNVMINDCIGIPA
jgi:hypothetical protein